MDRVTKLAHKTRCLIVVIAHGGKRDAADDPMQMIASTNALPASVEDVLVLFKGKDDEDDGQFVRRRLFMTGRHIAKHGTYILEKRPLNWPPLSAGRDNCIQRRRPLKSLLIV
jgi:hypothetical protein